MRKIIAAATTLAVLAVPAVSMAANTQTTVAKQAFSSGVLTLTSTAPARRPIASAPTWSRPPRTRPTAT